MKQFQQTITILCREKGFNDFTREVKRVVHKARVDGGLLTLFTQDVGCSLSIQEKNSQAIHSKMEVLTGHQAQGAHAAKADMSPVDMHDHTRMAMTTPSLSIPIQNGRPIMGTWQVICLYEHHSHAPKRRLFCHIIGN